METDKDIIVHATNKVDRISKLPNDVLVKILSRLTTEEAIKTSILSKRWMHVWKNIPHLFFNMQKIITINGIVLPLLLDRGAELISKVINNHIGHLETGIIFHYSYQCEDGILNSWIQSFTNVKKTKNLILANFLGRLEPDPETNVLNLSPNTFSHPNLEFLSLHQYILKDANSFINCHNLKRLDLLTIMSEVNVFNQIISSCPSLEILVLQIFFHSPDGNLKINHKNLKILCMSCNEINGIEVFATRLDILFIDYIFCENDKVAFQVPRLQFSRNYWVVGRIFPHISYNISCPNDQEKKSNENELVVKWPPHYVTRPACLSVSVDLKNPQEVEILKETLATWTEKMIELEIFFKNNNSLGKNGDSSNDAAQNNNIWKDPKPFPNAEFRVDIVWMYNFSGSSIEEFALVSRFVKQNTVLQKIMIKTTTFPEKKKLHIHKAIAKLNKLPKGNEELSIECF